MTHTAEIKECNSHRDKKPMYYVICTCGLHSQCWPDKQMPDMVIANHLRAADKNAI